MWNLCVYNKEAYANNLADAVDRLLMLDSIGLKSCSKYQTRQLPMGAGHCPWGRYTDRIVCNIHRDNFYSPLPKTEKTELSSII